MQRFKRRMAALLAAVMLLNALPPVAAAAEEDPAQTPESETADQEFAGGEAEETEQPVGLLEEATWPEEVSGGEPTHLEFQVNGKNISAYSKAKTFTTAQNYGSQDYDPNAGINLASLLGLEERQVEVDFTGYLPEELTEVTLQAFLGGQSLEGQDSVLWMNMGDDSYDRYTPGERLDLSEFVSETGSYSSSRTVQLIAGSFDQMDPNNIRYLVDFEVTNLGGLVRFQAYTGDRERINTSSYTSSTRTGEQGRIYYYDVSAPEPIPIWKVRSILAEVRFNESSALRQFEKNGPFTAEVYGGKLDAGTLSSATPITGQVWEQPNMETRGGYEMDASEAGTSWLTIVLRHNGASHALQRSVRIYTDETYDYLDLGFQALRADGTLWQTQEEFWPYRSDKDNSLRYSIEIRSDDWKGEDAALRMTYNERFEADDLSAAVYEGTFASEEEALQRRAEDISEKFWGANAGGYLRDYSGETPFTVILKKDGSQAEVIQLKVTVESGKPLEEKIRLSPADYLYSSDRSREATSERETAENGTHFYTMQYSSSESTANYPKDGQYYFYLNAYTTYPHEGEGYVNGKVDVKAA